MIKNVLFFLLGTSVGACSSLIIFAILYANREDNQKAELQKKGKSNS